MSGRILFVYLVLGFLFLIRFIFLFPTQKTYKDGEKVNLVGRIQSSPTMSGRFQHFSLQEANSAYIFVTLPVIPEYQYGETVKISGIVKKRMLENEKILNTIYMPKIEVVKITQDPFFSFRENIQSFFRENLSQAQAALLTGMVFGLKEDMPKDFSDDLRGTGVLHVVAASGMNVSIIGGVFLAVFQLFFKRRLALLFSIVGIGFYAILAGLQPSIVRAAIMGSIAFVGLYLGRQYTVLHVLFLTGFVMLLFDPRLLTDVGFQLSFLATLGILSIKPLFEKTVGKDKKRGILGVFREDFFTTFSAQLTTFPILLLTFGSFGLISLLVNTLVLWTVPFIMILGGIAGIIGLVLEPIATGILYLTLPFLFYFETIITLFGKFPLSLSFSSSIILVIGYYLCLLSFVLFRKTKP